MSTWRATKSEKAPNRDDADGFAFQITDAGERRGGEERRLAFVVLAADHDEIRAGEIGVDHRAGGGVDDIDIAAEQRLHRLGARADVEQIHVGAIFLIQAGVLADPQYGKCSGEGGVGDAQFGRLGVGAGRDCQ